MATAADASPPPATADALAAEAAAARTRVRTKEFQPAWTSKFGVQVAAREAVSGDIVSVKCLFCEYFGREGEGDDESRKRKRTANVQFFKKPWRGDNIASHMLKQHALRYAAYRALAPVDKSRYFGVNVDDADAVALVSVTPTANGATGKRGILSTAEGGSSARSARMSNSEAHAAAEEPTVAAVDAAVGMSRLVDSTSLLARQASVVAIAADAGAQASAAAVALLRPSTPANNFSASSLQLLVDRKVVAFVCGELLQSPPPVETSDGTLALIGFSLQPEDEGAGAAASVDLDAHRYLLHVADAQQLSAVAKLLVAGFSLQQCTELQQLPGGGGSGSGGVMGDVPAPMAPARALVHAQHLCAINYQALADALRSAWAFSLVLDTGVASKPQRAVIDVRVRFTVATTLYDPHLVVLPSDACDNAEHMLERITHALAAVCANWPAKLVGIALDSTAQIPESVAQVIAVLQREHVASPGCYTVWSGAREVDAVMQRSLAHLCDTAFVNVLAHVTSYVRRRKGLAVGTSRCPAVTSTQWLPLQCVLAWCVANSAALQQLVERESAYAPSSAWWVALYSLHAVAELARACVQSLESLAAHGAEQNRAIEKLLITLVAHGYVDGPSRFRADASACAVSGDYRVTFESAEMFVKKQGAHAAAALKVLAAEQPMQHAAVVRSVATMLACAASELATLRAARARMSGLSDILPAVRPQDLLSTTSEYDLSRLVSLQRDRLRASLSDAEIEAITSDFAAFLAACESDAALKHALDALPANASFAASWRSVGERFPALCRFAGGLASVYRDPSAAFAGMSTAADAATLEAALHAEQLDALRRLALSVAE